MAITFLIGGSSRGDVTALVVLRPVAVLLLGYGLSGLRRDDIFAYRPLFALAAACVALLLLQLVPLPPALWTHLPGRGLIAEIDRVAGIGPVWRPLSVAPAGTWNALCAMSVPLAVLVLAVRLTTGDSYKLLLGLIAIGLCTGVVALLQSTGPVDNPLTLYPSTNGAAAGLFGNRNHQAALLVLLLPMVAVAATRRWSKADRTELQAVAALSICAFLLPLVLVIGSRAGLIGAVLGLASAAWLYRVSRNARPAAAPHRASSGGPRARARSTWAPGAVAAGAIGGLSALTIFLGRAESFQRILSDGGQGEFRLQRWPSVIAMIGKYFPVGTGFGTFVPVFKIDEQRALLSPEYFNHAHNDFLELALTGGLPAMLLLAYATSLFAVRSLRLARTRNENEAPGSQGLARLGMVLLALLTLASIVDYPVRTPALSALFTLAAVWASTPLRRGPGMVDAL